MSSIKTKQFTLVAKSDDTVRAVLKFLSTTETNYVIATIETTDKWNTEITDLNGTALRLVKTFPIKVGQNITYNEFTGLIQLHQDQFDLYENGTAFNFSTINPTSITIAPNGATVAVGTPTTFVATVLPAGANQNVTWTINGVANADGKVPASILAATGTYPVIATSVVPIGISKSVNLVVQ